MENVYYYFDVLSDDDIMNETEKYVDNMRLVKDLFDETGTLRHINIDDVFGTELVLYNEDDEYMLMYRHDYENDDYTQMVQGNKHYIFHWITSFFNPDWTLDEIEILGE